MNNADMPANPTIDCADGHWADPETCTRWVPHHGMTKREHFAGLAMSGLIASGADESRFMADSKKLAAAAVKHADTLLAELDNDKEQGR